MMLEHAIVTRHFELHPIEAPHPIFLEMSRCLIIGTRNPSRSNMEVLFGRKEFLAWSHCTLVTASLGTAGSSEHTMVYLDSYSFPKLRISHSR